MPGTFRRVSHFVSLGGPPTFGCLVAALLLVGTARPAVAQQDPLLDNTTWNTTYTTPDGSQVNAVVRLRYANNGGGFGGGGGGGFGGAAGLAEGTYNSSFRGQPAGDGTLSQVRIEPGQRKMSPLPGPGGGGNWGLPNTQTKFIKGLWQFGGESGWFKWELYETGGGCKFTGSWGYLQNGQQGPQVGTWHGTLGGGGGGNNGGGGFGGALIPID